MRGASIDSDQKLIRVRLRCHISSKRPINNHSVNIIPKPYTVANGQLNTLPDDLDIEDQLKKLKAVKSVLTGVLGMEERCRFSDWRDSEYDIELSLSTNLQLDSV